MLVQRTGEQGQGNVWFVQNNFYYDAFFLKAIGEPSVNCPCPYTDVYTPVLNGGCPSGWCYAANGSSFHVCPHAELFRLSSNDPISHSA